jgi:5-methylcytosine-specific restriction endonuclease McrA
VTTGSTREWRRLRARVVAEEPICWLRLPGCTVRSTTADHIIPISVRPDLRMVRSNLRGACSHCNYVRQETPVSELDRLRAAPKQSEITPDPQRRARRHIAAQRKPAKALLDFFGGSPGWGKP